MHTRLQGFAEPRPHTVGDALGEMLSLNPLIIVVWSLDSIP